MNPNEPYIPHYNEHARHVHWDYVHICNIVRHTKTCTLAVFTTYGNIPKYIHLLNKLFRRIGIIE